MEGQSDQMSSMCKLQIKYLLIMHFFLEMLPKVPFNANNLTFYLQIIIFSK